MTAEERYPLLIGHSLAGRTRLRNIQEVANFICTHGQYGDLVITERDGTPFLNTFGIYIDKISDMEYREKRISDLGYYEPRDIRKNIKRIDRERRDYHRYYTGRDWENVENYDLMLNTASLGTEGAMEAIRAYLRIKEYEL